MADTEYIATQIIEIEGVRAHNPGDVVPEDNVKRYGWNDKVARRGTKAAQAAVEDATPDA